ncbi:apolipoprotein D and lipocalin family protein [Methylobacter tundripaludum]|uniref:Outer membrane lipoprotein Blc n=1 Tax=Methylobacter tundripaludum TaxID=173365 RepID=A0A2S6GNV7_9GAMM|nr:lipocalin family protein [Methylobacter tundripaludum]PPK66925.1 apolipoprotein D and lipocalin family protein [Methylobacter tundripaludum]
MKVLFILIAVLLTSCTGIPEGITAVEGFEINRYLGTWYEVARLDHRFERGLENISATYTLREDGGVDVLNKGWDIKAGEWREAEGKAYFVEQVDKGRLKVSFFGPFYGAYNIIELDKKDYAYSMVAGPDRSYLWILSRTQQLPEATLKALTERAKTLGFATDQLIFTKPN